MAQAIATIAVTGATSLAPGQTSQLTATALDARQNSLAGIRFAWSVQDGSANVVTVGPSGLVTAVGRGQKNVVAGAHGRAGVLAISAG